MAGAAAQATTAWSATSGIKAIAFDGLALFDPRPIFALAEQFFPGKSASLVATSPSSLSADGMPPAQKSLVIRRYG
jgi:hypothetical protein